MKKFILINLLFSLFCLSIYGQNKSDINIGILVPTHQENISSDIFRLLNTKLKSISNNNGVSSDMYGSFVMYPIVNILDHKLVEGGLKNMYVADVELSLFVKQIKTNSEYGFCNIVLKGTGNNLENAIKNAISKIDVRSNIYTAFLSESKNKIKEYYLSNKSSIINNAMSLSQLGKYEEAIASLMVYPETLEGYNEIITTATNLYMQLQNKICDKIIKDAQGKVALKEYENAINILLEIDSESICSDFANNLINDIQEEIKNEIKKEEDMEREFVNKIIDNEYSLESKRINAMRAIAIEFARNQQPQNYIEIIK